MLSKILVGTGVCCLVTHSGCGDMSVLENNTYIRNHGFPLYAARNQTCTYTIEELEFSTICAIRLDFDSVELHSDEFLTM